MQVASYEEESTTQDNCECGSGVVRSFVKYCSTDEMAYPVDDRTKVLA